MHEMHDCTCTLCKTLDSTSPRGPGCAELSGPRRAGGSTRGLNLEEERQ